MLGDRGIVCIDEFDKMSPQDRTAIHEVMEQQTVTIAKAGLHAQLNARCSVVAAANPIYGSFDDSMDLAKNIGLPDSLLSRFDLVYTVRDLTEPEEDRKIARQVIRQLRYRHASDGGRKAHDTTVEPDQPVLDSDEPTEVFQREHLYRGDEVLTVDFLRKLLHYCKSKCSPDLGAEAVEQLAEFYRDLRQRQAANPRSTVVTTRTLESAIRLATAHAKLRLHPEVTAEDVKVAKTLIVLSRGDELDAEPAPADDAKNANANAPAPARAPAADPHADNDRYTDFLQAFSEVRSPVALDVVAAQVNAARRPGSEEFSDAEVRQFVDVLVDRDAAAVIAGQIFRTDVPT